MPQSIQSPPTAQPHRGVDDFTEETIDAHLSKALAQLTKEDAILFTLDANERSLTFRLAFYLASEFSDFQVDCEYNRYYRDPHHRKRLRSQELREFVKRKTPIDDEFGLTVFPDIIVHRRETDDNLLVVEIKKTTSLVNEGFDLAKLRAYRKEIGYRFAKFIRLGTDEKSAMIAENLFVYPRET